MTGSVTGPDGEGSSTNLFVSSSGRMVIEPSDWLIWLGEWLAAPPLSVGHEILVTALFEGNDEIAPHEAGSMRTLTLAQGLANGEHLLELSALGDEPGLESLSVYNPLARTQPERERAPKFRSITHSRGEVQFEIEASGRYVLEGAETPSGPWAAVSAATTETRLSDALGGQNRFYRLRPID